MSLKGCKIVIGVDEAGRGPLAGPVVSAAVILKEGSFRERIDDSKKMSERQRNLAFQEITKKAIFAVGLKDHRVIDRKNILKATLASMKQAVRMLIKKYCRINNIKESDIKENIYVLVDGNMKLDIPYRVTSVIKGDSKVVQIACASIIAKVTRDKIMDSYDKLYPVYGFLKHKGYGTRFHMEAIKKFGPSAIHRKTFAPLKSQIATNKNRIATN